MARRLIPVFFPLPIRESFYVTPHWPKSNMASCKFRSHSWDYGSGGTRVCKRCTTRERFNTVQNVWQ